MNLLATRTRKTDVRALVRNDDGSYTVPLSDGWHAIVDADDAPLVGSVNWSASQARHLRYAVSRIAGKRTTLHRLLAGAGRDQQVRFANTNSLDCRRANLVLKARRS